MPKFEVIFESPFSTVYKTKRDIEGDDGSNVTVLAVKTASVVLEHTPEPHDIVKEARILGRLRHSNIIAVIHSGNDSVRTDLFSIWMPFAPYNLQSLLDCPHFTPPASKHFLSASRALIRQMISAVAYLHDPQQSVAHRDIKPANFLIDETGCLKLIDFGISYELNTKSKDNDMWPEAPNELYTQVATGSYRAPELLFGSQAYDPVALDLWSLGCTIAEFYTDLRICDDNEDDEDESPATLALAIDEENLSGLWKRRPLFDASRGDIGHAWNIFQIRGTPTRGTWPGFFDLPNARRLQFKDASPVPLRDQMPHLPGGSLDGEIVDFVNGLLMYPPEQRMSASEVLARRYISDFGDELGGTMDSLLELLKSL